MAFERPTGGRSAEKQGATAGQVRIFCEDSRWGPWKGPQVFFGNNPFNLEWSGLEWAEGKIASWIDGPRCDSAEVVAKTSHVLFSMLGVLAIFLLANQIGATFGLAPWAGLFAAIILATDELWLRYATYSMIENRVLALAMLAAWLALRRKALPSAFLWTLAIAQKPQMWLFLSGIWGGVELVRLIRKRDRTVLWPAVGALAAFGVGIAWIQWSKALGEASDVPWIIHSGPSVDRWYFGNWADRFRLVFWKNLGLDWLKRSSLVVVAPLLLGLSLLVRPAERAGLRKDLAACAALALPYLLASSVYIFVFWSVFIVHEYYALPLNVGTALTTGLVLAHGVRSLVRVASLPGWARVAGVLVAFAVCGRFAVAGWMPYLSFVRSIRDPKASHYLADWDFQVFPSRGLLVVMSWTAHGRGDLMPLYLTKQRGFMWCSQNEAYAPRKFWKEHGIQYLAWNYGDTDPATGRLRWVVRSIDEELAFARAKGWSSDLNDAWAGHSMAEWARIASHRFKDPCRAGEEDPRRW